MSSQPLLNKNSQPSITRVPSSAPSNNSKSNLAVKPENLVFPVTPSTFEEFENEFYKNLKQISLLRFNSVKSFSNQKELIPNVYKPGDYHMKEDIDQDPNQEGQKQKKESIPSSSNVPDSSEESDDDDISMEGSDVDVSKLDETIRNSQIKQSKLSRKKKKERSRRKKVEGGEEEPPTLSESGNETKTEVGDDELEQLQAEAEMAAEDVYEIIKLDPQQIPNQNRRIVLVRGENTKQYEVISLSLCLKLASWLVEQQGSENDEIEPFWLDFESPSLELMKLVSAAFGFHPLTVDDIMSNHYSLSNGSQLEKSEIFENYFFTILNERRFKPGTNYEIILSTHVLIFPNCVLTFRLCSLPPSLSQPNISVASQSSPLLSPVMNEFVPIEYSSSFVSILHRTCSYSKNPLSVHGPLWIAYGFLDVTSRLMKNLVSQLIKEVDALDELVLVLDAEEQSDLLRRIGGARKRSAELKNELYTKGEILSTILELQIDVNPRSFFKPNEAELSLATLKDSLNTAGASHIEELFKGSKSTRVYFRDVNDSIVSMQQQLETANALLDSLNNSYLSKVSIQVAEASNRMNIVMKKFSALATIFLPLTLVAGLFGMNVSVPGQHRTDNFPFYLICVLMTGFGIFIFYLFRRWNWI